MTCIRLEHHGYEGDQTAKHRRNLPLLRAEIERTPDRTYLWNHLGRVQIGLGAVDEGLEAWRHAIELVRRNGVRESVDALSFADLAMHHALAETAQPEFISEALGYFPGNYQLLLAAGIDALLHGEFEIGVAHGEALLSATPDEILRTGLSYSERLFTDWAHHVVGMCSFQLGDLVKAEHHFSEASRTQPAIAEYAVKAQLCRSMLAKQR